MKRYILLMMCLLAVAARGGAESPPTPFNAYDGDVPDARAIAMGEAFVSVGNSPAMVVYNPAGLTGITSNLFSATIEVTRQSALTTDEVFSGEALTNTNFQFLALTGPKGSLSWRPLCNETSTVYSGANWVQSQVKINAVTIAAAQQNSATVSTGLSLSYLMGTIAQSSLTNGIPFIELANGNGASADFGVLWALSPQIHLGLNLNNIFGMMWWDDFGSEQLPFSIHAGISFQITQFMNFACDWDKFYYRKDPDTDTDFTVDPEIGQTPDYIHFGLEQWLGKILALRVGAFSNDFNNQENNHFTAGLGYCSSGYSLSLACEQYRVLQTDVYRYVLSLDAPFSTSSSSEK